MRYLLFLSLLIITVSTSAQHCPWDCSGLLMIKTDATKGEMKKLDPVLVDINNKPVIDTLYGSGAGTYDLCRFLYYDDFLKFRINRIQVHYWYGYDTVYHFAKEHYVVRFNYCRYSTDGPTDLFIRYNDPSSSSGYKYIEIPASRRIHLHDYSREINKGQTAEILQSIQPFILNISRKEFGLL